SLYKISTKDGAVSQATGIDGTVNQVLIFDNNQIIFYGNGAEIFFADKGNFVPQKKTLALPEGERAIGTAIYNKKLYLLGEKNIYSYAYNNGYDKPTAWLKQETNILGNNSIAVDGNIWLAAVNGEISRLFMGKKEKFTLAGLYEPISKETRIYTADGLNNLYLLDQEKNRITITNKQGKVLRQILGDNLDKIAAIVPGVGEKELYILTKSGLYKLGL
ncbi:MAG TPA: hypothetical protein P5267_02880, partial [Patescibacteria group bacterium]|nr:hypothetical protein [Patescibacteria group bacterium]